MKHFVHLKMAAFNRDDKVNGLYFDDRYAGRGMIPSHGLSNDILRLDMLQDLNLSVHGTLPYDWSSLTSLHTLWVGGRVDNFDGPFQYNVATSQYLKSQKSHRPRGFDWVDWFSHSRFPNSKRISATSDVDAHDNGRHYGHHEEIVAVLESLNANKAEGSLGLQELDIQVIDEDTEAKSFLDRLLVDELPMCAPNLESLGCDCLNVDHLSSLVKVAKRL